MRLAHLALAAILAAGPATITYAQQQQSGPASDGSPAWALKTGSFPLGGRAGGQGGIAVCKDDAEKLCSGQAGGAARACLTQNSARLSRGCKTGLAAAEAASTAANGGVPACSHSPYCTTQLGGSQDDLKRVEWQQTLGYTFAYPFSVQSDGGGVSGVAINSKGNLWAFQRNSVGKPQLFEFGPDHKLIRAIGDDVITHQFKAHGITIDSHDNVWICDANGSTVKKLSPDGRVLMTIGVRGRRGDWNEAKAQRLLWQPLAIAFAPNGDFYIGEGHANESPNDVDSGDPNNSIGAARVLHFDKNGKFINQWYGNSIGPGKFTMAHAIAVDPKTGNVWVGDREQYRIVVYTGDGQFVKTISMRNLVCALYVDPHGTLWMATGLDGQVVKLDWNGNVAGAIGNGRGHGIGQFQESNYMAMDSQGNLYTGDTTVPRVTEMVAPQPKM